MRSVFDSSVVRFLLVVLSFYHSYVHEHDSSVISIATSSLFCNAYPLPMEKGSKGKEYIAVFVCSFQCLLVFIKQYCNLLLILAKKLECSTIADSQLRECAICFDSLTSSNRCFNYQCESEGCRMNENVCKGCIEKWNKKCPLCRGKLTKEPGMFENSLKLMYHNEIYSCSKTHEIYSSSKTHLY